MKNTALLFVAAIAIMTSIDFIWPFTTKRTDGDVFEQGLNTAEMLTYQDPDLGFTVRYPSFFIVQPDSLDEYTGHVRLSYDNEWATIVLECYALRNNGLSLKNGMDSLAQVLHAIAIIRVLSIGVNSGLSIRWFFQTAITTTSAGSLGKSTNGKCSRISAYASAVPTASCSTPYTKVTKRKERFSMILRM